MHSATVVDLFAGAGFFSYAFAAEEFEVTHAVENDPRAAATYALNVGNHVEVADVRSVQCAGRCDVLVAGPPCQGFSTLGKRRIDDPRNLLSFEVVRWARAMQPSIVIIENVAAFLNSDVWKVAATRLRRLGYVVDAVVLNAADYGVPQHRNRSFTFASRVGLPDIPQRSSSHVTVRDAWLGLNSCKPDKMMQHVWAQPGDLALKRMRVIPHGGDKRDVMRTAPVLAAPSWWKTKCEVTDAWGRMLWDEPSNTVRTCFQNASKGRYIHPEENRVISIREGARLQTVPDWWAFKGYAWDAARQIGNGVPPKLGRMIARAVRRHLS